MKKTSTKPNLLNIEIDLAKSLRKLRKSNDYTQLQISEIIGVHRSTYAYYETGKTSPSLESLIILSRFYSKTLEEIIGL